jgi:hypothetical protein
MNFEPIIRLPIMRTKAALIAATAVLLSLGVTALPVAAQSLADVARQEQDRRKNIKKPSKVLTNKDLGALPPASPGATPAAGATTPAAPAAGGDTTKPAGPGNSDAKAEDSGKDQAAWSGRMKNLQTALERDQTYAVAMQSQINALTTQYVNRGDPAQQAVLANDRQKAITELSRLTAQIEVDKKAIADLQEQARVSGVPAGWLR